MNVIRKDAQIEPVGPDDEFPGRFRVILSAPTLDRDGDTLLPDEWKTPLPEHITFDADHGMSVASTVGSGVPTIDPDTGNLIVDGTYSSIPRAQEVRTLVNEGHIRTTSVAFMTAPATEKGAAKKRELLNGAFVAIPSNREALVLDSKAATEKVGARNSGSDLEHIQAIHDHATALGASHGTDDGDDSAKSLSRRELKAVAGSFEQTQSALSDAVRALYPGNGDDVWAYPVATFPDKVVYRVSGGDDNGQWQASYTIGDDGTATLGTPERVNLVETILPVAKGARRKDADTEDASDPVALIQATDAAIDQAIDLLAEVDPESLPAAVQQAIALIQAADAAVDELMDALGIPDPDEDAEPATEPAAAAPAPAAASKAAEADSAVSDSDVENLTTQLMSDSII